MADLYTHKDSNIRKTWFLMTVFLAFIIALGWFFGYALQKPGILYGAIVLSFIMNGVAYWNSDKIALSLAGARPASLQSHPELFRIVENLSITAGLPMPKVFTIPGQQINAFATGRNPKHAVVAVTEGALQKLNKNELEGVISHELSHVGNYDILISSVVIVLVGLVAIVSDWFMRISFFGSGGDRDDNKGNALMIIGLAAAILAPIAATLIQLAISRKREFLADASGALLTRYPKGLASALEKIGQDSTPARFAHNSTAHLFISNPFRGKQSVNWLAKLFMTHPPIDLRIKALRDLNIT
ncbi:MAG: zinc metalloprotease HtpX [Candidatus Yanofskybacteria bacterium RIFCSPHIGHO2_01_FULL_41_27]|uniref:Protease HtpX homolog n=1 Tax=Candidatus Yanofskybacteria bacterium RIFCSPHIGHO2_01_FULL_41_27 TaxID=1802662 RepID=A0A1F8ED21_9BACT|nr:MAG: zinc metalloprotease HtpX [Candidatus Yanofskybacteria bacterium RIFCSPHIGHO2_01_FULL_41_27]OGN08733.1 MAG: zinc metalloprotease HtpX [Candidatus Yanofskybacteria bacterium RIFCSPHIGHO2_02_FULL_41_12]OGN21552.1 MAG: zinc metalloprotease HtpX [Candidatus Yanofskybacteria bacterium RIFCSPLOWO2_01_FULL_41_33]